MSEQCACNRVLCERISELEGRVENLKEALEQAPYPSDLSIAECDRDHYEKQRDELLAAIAHHQKKTPVGGNRTAADRNLYRSAFFVGGERQ